jgi:hypothetical protein
MVSENNAASKAIRASNDLLQEEYCKLIDRYNTDRKQAQQWRDNHASVTQEQISQFTVPIERLVQRIDQLDK